LTLVLHVLLIKESIHTFNQGFIELLKSS